MTTITTCGDLQQALLVKSILEGSGIPAFVPDELTAQNAPPYMWATGGIRVQVEDAQAENARKVLASQSIDLPGEPPGA
jgi:hypothetical protein